MEILRKGVDNNNLLVYIWGGGDNVQTSQRKYDYDKRYCREHYDQVNINVPKGARDKWKQYAKESGLSLNQFLIMAVEEKVMRDGL